MLEIAQAYPVEAASPLSAGVALAVLRLTGRHQDDHRRAAGLHQRACTQGLPGQLSLGCRALVLLVLQGGRHSVPKLQWQDCWRFMLLMTVR